MRYSLLSRFQGGSIGSLIGTAIAQSPQLETWQWHDSDLSPWHQISTGLARHLIDFGKLSQGDWEKLDRGWQSLLHPTETMTSGRIAVGMLPIALFFHDSIQLLREQLETLKHLWQLSDETVEDNLIWGYAIALALREKLDPHRFLSQLLSCCPIARPGTIESLEEIQTLLERGSPLETAIARLSRIEKGSVSEIMLALYCFSCTPEDMRLCLLRAARAGGKSRPIAALTGALAGIYNSYMGIPIHWRHAIEQQSIAQSIYRQGTDLFAIWSGTYELDGCYLLPSAAIAAPLTLQRRSSLKIISQGEYLFSGN